METFDNIITHENVDISYEYVKTQLYLRFDDEKIKLVARSQLNNRRMKTGENVTEFYAEIEKEGSKIGIGDGDLLFIFLNGLEKGMRKHVALLEPHDARSAFEAAKSYEQISSLDDEITSPEKHYISSQRKNKYRKL